MGEGGESEGGGGGRGKKEGEEGGGGGGRREKREEEEEEEEEEGGGRREKREEGGGGGGGEGRGGGREGELGSNLQLLCVLLYFSPAVLRRALTIRRRNPRSTSPLHSWSPTLTTSSEALLRRKA